MQVKDVLKEKQSVILKKGAMLVFHNGSVASLCSTMEVFKLSLEEGCLISIATDPILYIAKVCDGITMVNTGPCRYVVVNINGFDTSEAMIAYSDEAPAPYADNYVKMLNVTSGKAPYTYGIIQSDKFTKLSDELYFAHVDGKRCFIVIE